MASTPSATPPVSDVHLRILHSADAESFQRLRLRGLQDVPEAFGTTYEEDVALPIDVVAERLRFTRAPTGRVVLGAFMDGALAGFVGGMQSSKRKTRHKAEVWGTYVAPEARGEGLGRRLMDALIDEMRTWAGVERVTLSVVERAEPARRLYSALGFEIFGREPDAFRQDMVRDTVLHLSLALRLDRDAREKAV